MFWRYVQEVWNAGIIGKVTYPKEGPSILPFAHSDVLVYLDNAFREGYLQALVVEKDNIHSELPETLIAVGTSQGSDEDLARKQLNDLQEHLLEYLPQESAFYGEWLQFQRRYAQLVRLSRCMVPAIISIVGAYAQTRMQYSFSLMVDQAF